MHSVLPAKVAELGVLLFSYVGPPSATVARSAHSEFKRRFACGVIKCAWDVSLAFLSLGSGRMLSGRAFD